MQMKASHVKHQTQCTRPQTTKFNPASKVYEERAARIEKDSHNTNIFNGRNISDNTPASHFYQCKAKPELRGAEVRVATQPHRLGREALYS